MPNIARVFFTESYLIPDGPYTLKTTPIEQYKRVRSILGDFQPFGPDGQVSYFHSKTNNAALAVVTSTRASFNPDNLQAIIDQLYPIRTVSPAPLLPQAELDILIAEGYPVVDSTQPITIDLIEPVRWDAVLNQGQRNKFQGILDGRGILTDISAANTLGEAVNAVMIDWEPASGGLTNFDPAWFDKQAG